MIIKRFKPSVQIFLDMNGVSFATTAGKIREGVGTRYNVNAAAQKALDCLEFIRCCDEKEGKTSTRMVGCWESIDVELRLATTSKVNLV